MLDVLEQQAKGKAWETILENKYPTSLNRGVFPANFCLLPGHDYLQRHLNNTGRTDFPMCPLRDDVEEVDLGHIQ